MSLLVRLMALSLLFGSAGCTGPMTVGNDFDAAYIRQISAGRTTKTEVLAKLGPPVGKFGSADDHNETWVWSYENSGGGLYFGYNSARLQTLRLTFVRDTVADCLFASSQAGAAVCSGTAADSDIGPVFRPYEQLLRPAKI